jgi:hypothetical protein
MNELLRDRILRRLESLSDERGYQVLDYVEFLESRYAERSAPGQSVFAKFAETVEDTMRAGKLSASTIGETMGFLNRAMGVLNGVAAAGKTVATDIVNVATSAAGGGQGTSSAAGTPPASTPGAAPDSTARPGAPTPSTPPASGEQHP